MTRDNLQELRERLLREENVRRMIRARAYEIFQLRGGQPGGEAHDWFQAEGEVLAFLIADESQRVHQKEALEPTSTSAPVAKGKTAAAKKPKSRGKSDKKPASGAMAAKRVMSKKPTESESKLKRTRKQAKPESNE